MIDRKLRPLLEERLAFYPGIVLLGPRQVGKTTLAHALIGWVRGTGLMGGNDPMVAAVEAAGVRTWSTDEMAAELLAVAAHRDLPQLDEKLYLDVFAPPETVVPRRASARR